MASNGPSPTELNQLEKDLEKAIDEMRASWTSLSGANISLTKGIQMISNSAAQAQTTFTKIASTLSATASHTKSLEFFDAPRYRDTRGSLVYGVRLENTQPGHNKEYTVTVTANPLSGASSTSGANEYIVEGAWGPIGNTQQKQIKDIDGKRSTSNRTRAIEAAKDLERAKKAKGYVQQLVFEEDELVETADYSKGLDWTVTDDLIVDPNAPSASAVVEEVDRNCFCYQATEELSLFAYADPITAGLEIAPALMGSGFGFVKFDDVKRGPRWVITVLSSCTPYPEPHARAVPVGDSMDDPKLGDRKRSTPQYVEDLIVDAIDGKARRESNLDFTLLVEEKGIDLVVVDAFRWEGEDLTDTPWMERRNSLDSSFRTVFSADRKAGRHVELAPRIVNRLRESYLSEGDKYRFELYQSDSIPGAETWLMPRL